ncbi:hypothetical protein Poly30_51000 [Planctomycetes bacterium Poly30]|uniref:Uncharacterized protein n=1 Tax=Saltatorellus ferox TaxID=2528018 RepID=A0A518EZN1_9BACT|nr:hypothetical protein Poly30_51000 [Planctomycetes bacterium Poly30]
MTAPTATETELPSEVLGLPIQGQNLAGARRLGELLGRDATTQPDLPATLPWTLLAFLRHFG